MYLLIQTLQLKKNHNYIDGLLQDCSNSIAYWNRALDYIFKFMVLS